MKSQETIYNKRVFFFQQRNWGKTIGHYVAQRVHALGGHLGCITIKRSTHEFIIGQKDVPYEMIMSYDDIMEDPQLFLGRNEYSLTDICRELKVDSIWPFVWSLRNYVRSYKDKYFYSFKQNVPDEGIVEFIKAVFHCIKKVFDEFRPDVIIAPNFVSLPHIMFYHYAKKRGVPMIGVTDSKVSGVFIFTNSFRDDEGAFYDHVETLNSGVQESVNKKRARQYIDEFRQAFKTPAYQEQQTQKKTFWRVIRHAGAPYYNILKWYVKRPVNIVKTTGITADYRSPKIILRDHYAHDYYKRSAERFHYYPFEKVGKFVYFPLQFQPEATIDVVAPYFSNQIETARLLAMSLPDDYTLVVKEHPGMIGLRPKTYLEKVSRTPNVKLIDYRIPSGEVLKKCDLVISPNSTTLAEAAFFYKPAIQLGDLGTTKKLPNVFIHTDMATISKKIKEILKTPLQSMDYEKKLENFVAAAYDTGFELDYLSAWHRGEGDLESLWKEYKKEIERVLEKK